MMVYNYILDSNRTVRMRLIDLSDTIGKEGQIVYKRFNNITMTFMPKHIHFISQIWFSNRCDSWAVGTLLNDRYSRQLIMKRKKKEWKKWNSHQSFRPGRRSSKYLFKYLSTFDSSDRLVTRLIRTLHKEFNIYTLKEFINNPVSLIRLKDQRGIGMKTVELYYKAYNRAKVLTSMKNGE